MYAALSCYVLFSYWNIIMKSSPSEYQILAVPWDPLSVIYHIFELSREVSALHIECQLPPSNKPYEYLHVYYNLEIKFYNKWHLKF